MASMNRLYFWSTATTPQLLRSMWLDSGIIRQNEINFSTIKLYGSNSSRSFTLPSTSHFGASNWWNPVSMQNLPMFPSLCYARECLELAAEDQPLHPQWLLLHCYSILLFPCFYLPLCALDFTCWFVFYCIVCLLHYCIRFMRTWTSFVCYYSASDLQKGHSKFLLKELMGSIRPPF